jgi:hypothetical protein
MTPKITARNTTIRKPCHQPRIRTDRHAVAARRLVSSRSNNQHRPSCSKKPSSGAPKTQVIRTRPRQRPSNTRAPAPDQQVVPPSTPIQQRPGGTCRAGPTHSAGSRAPQRLQPHSYGTATSGSSTARTQPRSPRSRARSGMGVPAPSTVRHSGNCPPDARATCLPPQRVRSRHRSGTRLPTMHCHTVATRRDRYARRKPRAVISLSETLAHRD